jgi:RNA-directed DNA polymerase
MMRSKRAAAFPVGDARLGERVCLAIVTRHGMRLEPGAILCGKSRRGSFQLQRKTRRDRMRAKLQEIKAELRLRMHQTIPAQGHWLRQVVTGHFAYYAVPTNSRALSAFRHYLTDLWRRTLRRRSQKDGFTWVRMTKLADGSLPAPRILRPWPEQRFAVKHPR